MLLGIALLFIISCGSIGGGGGAGFSGILNYSLVDDGLDFTKVGNNLEAEVVDDNRFGSGTRKRIWSGESRRIKISGKNSTFQISNVTSAVGNNIEVDKDNNEILYTDSKNRLSDILTVTGSFGDNNIVEEKVELRLSKESKICYGIYLAGDNDLNGGKYKYSKTYDFVLRDLNEILNVTFNSSNISVLIFLDVQAIAKNHYYKNTPFKEPGIYEISNGKVSKLRNYEEPNTGHKDTLKGFLNAMSDYVDAEKYILDMWSHGFSILGVGYDITHKESNGKDESISPKEFREAIEHSHMHKLDVLVFSACLMMDFGLMYELKDVVNAISGSADFVPGDGTFYGNAGRRGIIGEINANTHLSAQDLAILISQENYNSYLAGGAQYNPYVKEYLTYSAVDLTKIEAANLAMIDLFKDGNNLRLQLADILTETIIEESVFYGRFNNSGTKGTGDLIDIGSLAYVISQHHSNEEFKNKASALYELTKLGEGLVIYHKHIREEGEFRTSTGLTMLYHRPSYCWHSFPHDRMKEVDLYKNSGWEELFSCS